VRRVVEGKEEGPGLTYRAAGKSLGVRARDCRGEIPGGDRGGALRGGAEEGDDGVGPPVSGRAAENVGAGCGASGTGPRWNCWAGASRSRFGAGSGKRRATRGRGSACWSGEQEPGLRENGPRSG